MGWVVPARGPMGAWGQTRASLEGKGSGWWSAGPGAEQGGLFALLLLQGGLQPACPAHSQLSEGFSLVFYLQLNGTLDNRPL